MSYDFESIEHWTYMDCPYCQAIVPLTDDTFKDWCVSLQHYYASDPFKGRKEPDVFLHTLFCKCPKCGNTTILAYPNDKSRLIPIKPLSFAKTFPDYVPLQVRKDYEEAFSIMNLSPKASATLARRCLQGIIRDFYNITENTLNGEICKLEKSGIVSPDIIETFNDLRKIGNIGAHMEKDVNYIVDIDPNEAEILLNFIEYLIEQTYINRYKRQNMLNSLHIISENKQTQRKSMASTPKKTNNTKTAQTVANENSAVIAENNK